MADIVTIAGEKTMHHVQPLLQRFELKVAQVSQCDLDAILSHSPRLVLCFDDYHVLYSNVLAQFRLSVALVREEILWGRISLSSLAGLAATLA